MWNEILSFSNSRLASRRTAPLECKHAGDDIIKSKSIPQICHIFVFDRVNRRAIY